MLLNTGMCYFVVVFCRFKKGKKTTQYDKPAISQATADINRQEFSRFLNLTSNSLLL